MNYERMSTIYNEDIDNLPEDVSSEEISELQLSYVKTMVEWLNWEGIIDDKLAQQIVSNA